VLKLPPPVWALVYVLIALVVSWQLGWPKVPGLPLPTLGLILALLPWILPVWAVVVFRRAGTEIDPTSPTNRTLIVDGPYHYTRNPMYLGLVLVRSASRYGWVRGPCFSCPVPSSPPQTGSTSPLRKPRCVVSSPPDMTITSSRCGAGCDAVRIQAGFQGMIVSAGLAHPTSDSSSTPAATRRFPLRLHWPAARACPW
jgi:hypothetical protein